jgi:hypothetical protein
MVLVESASYDAMDMIASRSLALALRLVGPPSAHNRLRLGQQSYIRHLFREAEVGQPDVPVRVDQDVLGL